MKKGFAVLVGAFLLLGMSYLFASAGPAQLEEPMNQAPENSAGSVYYLNFKPEQSRQWMETAKRYTEITGVPVTVVTAASGTYEDTLRAEMEKNEPPTLFQVNGPTGLRSWREYCLDLRDTALYQQLRSDEFALFDGGEIPAVAYAIESYGLICNQTLLQQAGYEPGDITNFETLKAVAEDIHARREELGFDAFTSAGMDASSDWRFKTHLANLPIYYEYQAEGVSASSAIRGTFLDQYRQIWDLYIHNAVCAPGLLGARTGEDAAAEFALGEAVFYQNGTWAYADITAEGLTDDDLTMLPIYIGAPGEEEQGLCTGSENYWCINRRAAPEDIEATKAFVEWLVTSDEGRAAMAVEMGFVTPFQTFDGYMPQNALQKAAAADLASGRTPVRWDFTTIPSETWKNRVGAALLEYAQGTADWKTVETAFVEGWTAESQAVQ